MDAREFLGIEPVPDGAEAPPLKWRLAVAPQLSTPGKFLFGGCGLGAALVALEAASGRPTVWATAQYLSFAATGSTVDYEVSLVSGGAHVTQGRVTARCGDQEILTVNAALGHPVEGLDAVWVTPPDVPAPEDCPRRSLPEVAANSILDRIDVRIASGRMFDALDGSPGSPRSALWARVPGHLAPSAATLAIFGDYVSGGASQPLGRRTSGRSLDNTLRIVRLQSTEWVLCDIRMHATVGGFAHGHAYLWSADGVLLAAASQSFSVRLWADEPRFRR